MKWMVVAILAVAMSVASHAGAAQQSAPGAPETVLDGDSVELEVDRATVELVLDGVIVAQNPADSIALVRRAGARRARPLRIGHTYDGYVLIEVTRTSVLLAGVGQDLRLTLPGQEAEAASPERNASRQSAETESPSSLPAAEPEPVWLRRSFSRAEAGRRLENEIPVILSDTELTPRVVEGEVRGLELIRLPDGTVLSESGLLPGDVLKSLNGEPLRGLDALWELLARFSEDDELRLVVERRGEVMRFAYALTN